MESYNNEIKAIQSAVDEKIKQEELGISPICDQGFLETNCRWHFEARK